LREKEEGFCNQSEREKRRAGGGPLESLSTLLPGGEREKSFSFSKRGLVVEWYGQEDFVREGERSEIHGSSDSHHFLKLLFFVEKGVKNLFTFFPKSQ